MIDDPLSLVLWSSWIMAAGMYPMGFLFGTCSACCQQCPDECSKCTHYANAGYDCAGLYNTYTALTISVGDYGSVTINNPQSEPSSGCGDHSIDFSINDLPVGPNQYTTTAGTPCLLASSLTAITDVDECGCNACSVQVVIYARVTSENSGNLVMRKLFAKKTGECSKTTLQLTASSGFIPDTGYNMPDAASVIAWFNGLRISVSVTLPECDCGACCDDGCQENVAEGGCNTWQGVGVDCDPDPCV